MTADELIQVDFHCHTIYSKDSLSTPEKLLATCRRKGLDRVAITDHNTIAGALHAKDLDPDRVIIGEEILTTEGELLAFFVKEEIPSGLTPQVALGRLKDQGSFISVSHPFDILRPGSWKQEALLEIVPYIDAVETFNARCVWPGYNWQALKFARQHGILGTHGSDAHAAFELGRGSLLLPPFHDANSLRRALGKSTSPALTLSTPLVRLSSRYAVWRKKLQKA